MDLGRRRFLTGAAAAAVAPAAVGVPTLVSAWGLEVRRYRVPVEGLPAALDGLRIVQLSDTHLGAWVHIRRAVRKALELRPDVYALTGDYVHISPDYIGPGIEVFRELV